MISFEHTEVIGWEHAIRGMRNPMNSWHLIDTDWFDMCDDEADDKEWLDTSGESVLILGDKDLDLMKRLRNAGTDHRKFMRMIVVYVDITAPLYWWKEFDTYKVGTVANSTSTMHKIMSKPFELSMFEIDDFKEEERADFEEVLKICNKYRDLYIEYKDDGWDETAKKYWKALIRILPESFLQTRTVTMNYEILRNIVHQRANHKLTEWHSFIRWASSLPYSEEFIFYKN